MGQDPAFLFYPSDFLGGTLSFTLEEKGAYLMLLILQFNEGRFDENQAKIVLGDAFPKVWEKIRKKFTFRQGFYWNNRLDIEKEKRAKFCKSRRDNRLSK